MPGMVRAAKVDRWYMDAELDIPVADVSDSYGGVYSQCKLMSRGGGDSDSYDYAPPPVTDSDLSLAENGEVLIAFPDGKSAHPVILGTIYVAKAMKEQILTQEQDQGNTSDYGSDHHIYDRILKHRGIRMVYASSGTWLLDMTLTKKPARIQLDTDSFLRISMNGQANDFVLLGTPFLKHTRSIHKRIDELALAIKANGADIDTLSAHTHGYDLTTSNGGTAAGDTMAGPIVTGDDPTTAKYPFDFSHGEGIDSPNDGGSDKLKAGCLRISTTSVDSQGGE